MDIEFLEELKSYINSGMSRNDLKTVINKKIKAQQLNMHDVVGRSEQLKAVEELVDFARDVTNVCDLDRLEEILDRL